MIADIIRKRRLNTGSKSKNKSKNLMFESWASKFNERLKQSFLDKRLVFKKQEKHNKWGVAVKPDGIAITYHTIYILIILLGTIIASVGAFSHATLFIIIGIILGMIWCPVAVQQGKAKMDAEENVFSTVFDVLKAHMTIDPELKARDVIKILEWSSAEEPQLIADGRVKALEDGEIKQFEADLPKKDKNGLSILPKIAGFRSTPTAMEIDFPATFREASTDDTLTHLNEAFGHVTEWVAEREEKGKDGKKRIVSGWDFAGHKAYLKAVPPLPTRALMPKDFDKNSSWNQIKLGRTVTGEAVWDLSQTPMSLVPLSASDTFIWRKNDSQNFDAVPLNKIAQDDICLACTGEETHILEATDEKVPNRMFNITFKNLSNNQLFTVKAADVHEWSVDVNETLKDSKFRNGSDVKLGTKSMDSSELYNLYTMDVKVVLTPIVANNELVYYQVYSISFTEPVPSICLKVDNPTHTFMIASTHNELNNIKKEDVMACSIPTHNCGSPLSVSTVLTKENGEETTMLDVQTGDKILGSDNKYVTVEGLSDIMKPDNLYKMTLQPCDNFEDNAKNQTEGEK